MPPRNTNDSFLDKFLGVFGVKRPKKRRKSISKRRKINSNYDNFNPDMSINENF